jgi:protein-S-isoprenylcysteine O-methyltransferase Ste14
MLGFLLVIPLFLIRYGLLFFVNKDALKRAAFFPPRVGFERVVFWVYQLSMLAMFIYMVFTKIVFESNLFYIGILVYIIGILLCSMSTVNFGKTNGHGINTNGLYNFSRNPMYIAYFVYLLGCVLITQSIVLFALLIIFQVSTHWIILSEERWCLSKFGEDYKRYMKKVRRYF